MSQALDNMYILHATFSAANPKAVKARSIIKSAIRKLELDEEEIKELRLSLHKAEKEIELQRLKAARLRVEIKKLKTL